MNYTNWHVNNNTLTTADVSIHHSDGKKNQKNKTKWEKAAFRGSPVTLTATSECWRSAGNALAAHLNISVEKVAWQVEDCYMAAKNMNVNDCELGSHEAVLKYKTV